ncbi:hypothetical protein M9Y10_044351 [Tritrichomonas musculus]|uniref:G domain-containing protein n=1 Tax=Tritrichomonas musculus TaxID=1915356 RepID=A0ABR2GNN9_9EUKA
MLKSIHSRHLKSSSVVKLVYENIDRIKVCFSKDIVIILGREQTGKSTTINALLGVIFDICEEDDSYLKPTDEKDVKAPMGSYNKGVMCTVFPTAYIDKENNIIYLDTQGFFGTEKIPEYEAAASILLDAAIRGAKTVKIVYLEDYNRFHEGYTGIAESIKLLNTTVKDFGIPIYCLFNKYRPSFYSIKSYIEKSDEQKNDFICKKLVEDSKKVVSGVKTSYLNLIEHYKSCENIDEMIPKEKNVNSLELKGACLIEFNFNCGRFGYIDPTSEWSVNNLKNKIMKLPSIDKKGLSFNYSNENRINFEKEFESDLRYNMIPILNDINFCLKYPPDLISNLNDINALKIQKNCDLISLLEEGYEIDQENMDEIMKINENKKK